MELLATTNRGLETVAIEEIEALTGATATVRHPGMVAFRADEQAVYRLIAGARSIHRVLLTLARGTVADLDEIYQVTRESDPPASLSPDRSFAVRAQRRGEQPFESPDVASTVGQAVIDSYDTPPAVELDDPAVVLRAMVRGERFVLAADTTGRSLHRRWYRRVEHDAALRPTVAYSMLHVGGYDPTDRLVDPMCGCGTISIEAALAARDRSPATDREPALVRLRPFDADRYRMVRANLTESGTTPTSIVGRDAARKWITGARENAAAAGVIEDITFAVADATDRPVAADLVAVDLPFGVRTDSDPESLYAEVFDALGDNWDRLVALTTREELVPYEPARTIEVRRGRLDASVLLIE
jgi:Predicted N6-adenine-specific DNA methylase